MPGDMYRIHNLMPVALICIIATSLIFANIFYPFGLEQDSYSKVIFIPWVFLVCIYFIIVKKIKRMGIFYALFLLILVISIVIGGIKSIITDVYLESTIYNFLTKAYPKILFLLLMYFLIKEINRDEVIPIVKIYTFAFLSSVIIALIVSRFVHLDRFIFYYSWAGQRFAGFHYEIVNFVFSFLISSIFIVFLYFRNLRFPILLVLILFVLIISKSNAVPVFAAFVLFSYFLMRIKNSSLRYYTSLFFFYLILLFLFNLESISELFKYIKFIFPRFEEGATYNSLIQRVTPMISAVDYTIDNFFSLPYGLYNSQIDLFFSNIAFFGGFGLSKLIADLLWLSIPFLIICIFSVARVVYEFPTEKKANNYDMMIFMIFFLCIGYIIAQAGFFNFSAWSFIFLGLRYFNIVK